MDEGDGTTGLSSLRRGQMETDLLLLVAGCVPEPAVTDLLSMAMVFLSPIVTYRKECVLVFFSLLAVIVM